MSVHSQTVRGALVFYEGNNRARWIDAIGHNVHKVVVDGSNFLTDDTTGDLLGWTHTVVEAGTGTTTMVADDTAGGGVLLTCAAGENDGLNTQHDGEGFTFDGSRDIMFGLYDLQINDVTDTDLFVGFAVTDTTILGGATDRIGWQSLDGAATLMALVEKDSTETITSSLATLTDATTVDLEFVYNAASGTIQWLIDGATVSGPAVTNLPDDEELRLSLHFLTGETVANTLKFRRLVAIQIT